MIFADLLARWTSGVRAVPRHAFFRQVTLPIIALILLLCGLVSGGVAWEIDRSDTTVLTRQTRMARMAVDASVDDLAYQQQSDALWQPLADKVRQPHLDTAWLDENCGAWLYRMFDHDWVILLDRQDRVAYAAFHGRQVPAAAVAALRPTLQPLIDGVRGRTKDNRGLHDRRPDGLLAKGATVLTKAPAIHESDLALVGHSPAVGSAMRVMGVSADGRTASDTGFLMINLRFLDGTYLAQVSKRNLLENLHFALRDTHVAGEHSFPLFNADGETIGYFHWTPDMPGKHIVRVIVPGAIAGLALLIAALLWLERSLRRSTGRLTTSLGELADRNRELESERLAVRAAQDEREAALLREARHLDRERDTEMLRQAEEARRAELLSVAARFEESVMGAVGSVGSAAEQLAQSAIALADLSAESGRQTSQAAERVNHVSVAADAVAEGIGSLSRSISHISDRADQQASLSDEALSNTQSGTAAMQGLVGRAEGIADFTDLIATIASRTNLLALNATIEAARAGDAGRGFAVVAGEIKTLAGQAAGANKEIGSLIHAVRGSADSARHSLGDITTAVNAFATSADAIHSSVSAQRETAAMIERNASETAREAGSIAQQIHRVAEAARDAGALSRQVTGAADSLLQDATLMRGATENFLAMLRQSSGGGVGR